MTVEGKHVSAYMYIVTTYLGVVEENSSII